MSSFNNHLLNATIQGGVADFRVTTYGANQDRVRGRLSIVATRSFFDTKTNKWVERTHTLFISLFGKLTKEGHVTGAVGKLYRKVSKGDEVLLSDVDIETYKTDKTTTDGKPVWETGFTANRADQIQITSRKAERHIMRVLKEKPELMQELLNTTVERHNSAGIGGSGMISGMADAEQAQPAEQAQQTNNSEVEGVDTPEAEEATQQASQSVSENVSDDQPNPSEHIETDEQAEDEAPKTAIGEKLAAAKAEAEARARSAA